MDITSAQEVASALGLTLTTSILSLPLWNHIEAVIYAAFKLSQHFELLKESDVGVTKIQMRCRLIARMLIQHAPSLSDCDDILQELFSCISSKFLSFFPLFFNA